VETINRIVDVFPSNQQAQVRTQLSFVLEGVICQQLLPTVDGSGRVLAMEIMFPSTAIRNLIREGKTHQIYSNMQTSQTETSMQTMSQSLLEHYQSGHITEEECLQHAPEYKEMKRMLEGRDAYADTGPVKKVAKDNF
jgi:twitching motility protein PilT